MPRREISEVGDRFIRIRKTAGGDENVLPIPDEMLPLLRVLGLLVGGNVTDALDGFAVTFGDDPSGWQVGLAPRTSAAERLEIRLVGCGERLERIEIDEPGGVRRTYFLGDD